MLIPFIATCLLILNPELQAQAVYEGATAAPSGKAANKKKEPKSSVHVMTDHPVHLFILSGQSNMARMDPETGFMTEAVKLFGEKQVGYIKVAKGGQPICRWLAEWEDIAKAKGLDERHLVHHVGAWLPGEAAQSKHARVSIQNKRFTLVNNKNGEERFDLKNDPGETTNVITDYPEVVEQLRKLYDQWWTRMQPGLVNEDAYQSPAE